MKAVVAVFNQEKALVGAFSVITNLRMKLLQALGRGHPTTQAKIGTSADSLHHYYIYLSYHCTGMKYSCRLKNICGLIFRIV